MSQLAALTLAELEITIEQGLETLVEVGLALLEIRDRKLYKDTHKTFEAYCRERWGWSRQHAYRQIGAAKLVREMSPTGDKPENEWQARAIRKSLAEKHDRLDNLPEHERKAREAAAEQAIAPIHKATTFWWRLHGAARCCRPVKVRGSVCRRSSGRLWPPLFPLVASSRSMATSSRASSFVTALGRT